MYHHQRELGMTHSEIVGKLAAGGVRLEIQSVACLSSFIGTMESRTMASISEVFDAYQWFKAGWEACERLLPDA